MPRAGHIAAAEIFGPASFPLAVHRVPRHAPIARHSHGFDELVVILAGAGRHEVGRETYDIEAGDVFVLLGDMKHGYSQTRDLALVNILYDWRRLGLMRADLATMPGFHALFEIEPRFRRQGRFANRLRLGIDDLGRLADMLAELEGELGRRSAGHQFAAISCFMRLVVFLSRSYSRVPAGPPRPVTQLSEVLGFMEAHFDEPLSVADLADVACMSQTSLFRTFQRVLGRSPIEYLIHVRIAKARALLARRDLSITEVASAAGFADSNYFSRQFRRIVGLSPRQHRRRVELLGGPPAERRSERV